MSNIPVSGVKIQIEGAQTNAPTSESLIQAMGGAINYIFDRLDPVGSYKMSSLTEVQFQAELTTTLQEWILADGRSVVGSKYQTLTGNANAPDARGIYLRGKNNGRVDGNEDPSGDFALETYEVDKIRAHNHVWSNYDGGVLQPVKTFDGSGNLTTFNYTLGGSGNEMIQSKGFASLGGDTYSNTPRTHYTSGISNYNTANVAGIAGSTENFAETRVKSLVVNTFIRIN